MNKHNDKMTTLDNKHTEMLEKFKNNENILIPKYNAEICKLEKSLNNIKNPKNPKTNKNKIIKMTKLDSLNSQICELRNKIYKMEKEKNDYFLNNAKYIFDYFEEKKNINNNEPKNINNIKTKKITEFFNNNNNDNEVENINKRMLTMNTFAPTSVINSNNTNLNTSINSMPENDKNEISSKIQESLNDKSSNVEKYFYNLNNTIINYNNYCYKADICKYCHKGEMVYVESEGISICNYCSITIKYLIENEKPSYKEPPKEVCFYAYKRINHLREILAQFQAKESTHIPEEIYENLKNQIKKERIEIKDLTNKKTKEILKNLGYNKYYEHIPFIKDKLGIKPPVMNPELEETLCNLFMEIQKPYSKYCPKDRVNFLNYYYTLYKLCELLGETNFLSYFPMLKDREKRVEQDQIWKKICFELNWKFIPTA